MKITYVFLLSLLNISSFIFAQGHIDLVKYYQDQINVLKNDPNKEQTVANLLARGMSASEANQFYFQDLAEQIIEIEERLLDEIKRINRKKKNN